jgi:hypothetical protein
VVGAVVLTGLGLGGGTASAQVRAASSGGEQIDSYRVNLAVRRDGSMHVSETIAYDFASSPDKHGILREIPIEVNDDSVKKGYDRVYPISNIKVTSPTGPHGELDTKVGKQAVLQIGNGKDEVSGQITYVISYDLKGVVNTFSNHQEVFWNAVGTEWEVPIGSAQATVTGPAGITQLACFDGPQGSTQNCPESIGPNGAGSVRAAAALGEHQGLTVVASFPSGTFTQTAPILKRRWSVQRAFSANPFTIGGAVALLALLGGWVIALVSRRGRDERFLGLTPGLEPGLGQDAAVGRVPLRGGDPVAVQFTPPAGLRPGEVGTLIDEKADVVDVTATIVDLAVRGWFTIEEIDKPGRFQAGDWQLNEIQPPPSGEGLTDYETRLLNSLFESGSPVKLSSLRQHFASDFKKTQALLYDDVTGRGWFRGNPSSVRARWAGLGLLFTLVGAGATFLLARFTTFGLGGIAVLLPGLLLLALSGRMPARTAKGTAARTQALGFRLYLTTAEADQIRFEEGQDIFSRYLPYAIVFGVAERWAGIFAELARRGVDVVTPTWYFGTGYLYGAAFDYAAFGSSLDSFSSTAASTISAPTPSSSGASGFGGGGFSGGGGGGGGGGSW